METKDIIGLVFLAVTFVFAFGLIWRFKKMKEQRQAMDAKFAEIDAKLKAKKDQEGRDELARAKLRQHPNYGHARFDPKNPDTLLPTKREIAKKYSTTSQTQVVGNNSVGVQSGNDVDWLTPALIFATMNSHSGRVSAKVDDEIGSVTFKEEPKQKEESSYSSSYSSNNDDDDRKSSYSSSYSSSSDDSSYSSGGSDSSYSSSFSSD